ncbi:MAG TPA: DUF4058 family protein [Planctomycetaceae bacterium]
MPSAFPGMDPYLESPAIWPDFHDHLASEIGAQLNQLLPAPYYAKLEMRPEIGIIADDRIGIAIVPDVSIAEAWPPRPPPSTTAVVERPRVEVSKSIDLIVYREPLKHHFLEVRDSKQGHKLVTLIEILSPSNKRRGSDREAYEKKQRAVLETDANMIELDLLRDGERIYASPQVADLVYQLIPQPDYLVIVNRASLRQERGIGYHLFPVGIRDALPSIPIPLRKENCDIVLDLQFVLNRAYDRGPYSRGAIDYAELPVPPVRGADATWANELLERAKLIPAQKDNGRTAS